MQSPTCLPTRFYERPVASVARDLLGMRLVRILDGERLSGMIVETEAYDGQQDQACHARVGKTQRTAVMFGKPGAAYVYFTYGMHWMLNAVTGPAGYPAAVLIRAIYPLEGMETIAARRGGVKEAQRTNGPAKLTSALGIDRKQNGVPLVSMEGDLWIEQGEPVIDAHVVRGPRIGIQNTPEPWRSTPWRFLIPDPAKWLPLVEEM